MSIMFNGSRKAPVNKVTPTFMVDVHAVGNTVALSQIFGFSEELSFSALDEAKMSKDIVTAEYFELRLVESPSTALSDIQKEEVPIIQRVEVVVYGKTKKSPETKEIMSLQPQATKLSSSDDGRLVWLLGRLSPHLETTTTKGADGSSRIALTANTGSRQFFDYMQTLLNHQPWKNTEDETGRQIIEVAVAVASDQFARKAQQSNFSNEAMNMLATAAAQNSKVMEQTPSESEAEEAARSVFADK